MSKENVVSRAEAPEVLTVDEVAKKCRVTSQTVYGWLNSGTLKGTKLAGNVWRIHARHLATFRGEDTELFGGGDGPATHE